MHALKLRIQNNPENWLEYSCISRPTGAEGRGWGDRNFFTVAPINLCRAPCPRCQKFGRGARAR